MDENQQTPQQEQDWDWDFVVNEGSYSRGYHNPDGTITLNFEPAPNAVGDRRLTITMPKDRALEIIGDLASSLRD